MAGCFDVVDEVDVFFEAVVTDWNRAIFRKSDRGVEPLTSLKFHEAFDPDGDLEGHGHEDTGVGRIPFEIVFSVKVAVFIFLDKVYLLLC